MFAGNVFSLLGIYECEFVNGIRWLVLPYSGGGSGLEGGFSYDESRERVTFIDFAFPFASDCEGANGIIQPTKINLFLDSGRVSVRICSKTASVGDVSGARDILVLCLQNVFHVELQIVNLLGSRRCSCCLFVFIHSWAD